MSLLTASRANGLDIGLAVFMQTDLTSRACPLDKNIDRNSLSCNKKCLTVCRFVDIT